MEQQIDHPIMVTTLVSVPVALAWECYTIPEHVMQWNYASNEWHCPTATSNFVVGGQFSYTMAAKDGSVSFDFGGTFTEILQQERIAYTIDGDGRKVFVSFVQEGESVRVTVEFDPEHENSRELQQSGWQVILYNFKQYTQTLVVSV